MRQPGRIAKWFHTHITMRLFKNPAIRALGLYSGIRYNLGIAREGRDYIDM